MINYVKKACLSLFLIFSSINSYGFATDSERDMNHFPDIVATYSIKDYSVDGVITLFTRIGGNAAAFVVHKDDVEKLYQYEWHADLMSGGDNLWLKHSNDQSYPYFLENQKGEKVRAQFHGITTDFLGAHYNKIKNIRHSFYSYSEILIDYYDIIGKGIVWSVNISYLNPELLKNDLVIFGIEDNRDAEFNFFVINCDNFKEVKTKLLRYIKNPTDF